MSENKKLAFLNSVRGYSWIHFEKNLGGATKLTSLLDINLYLALQHLESQCTIKYGFLTQVSTDPLFQRDSSLAIPNIFDTALIIDIIDNAGLTLSNVTSGSVKNMLLESRTSEGLWNYFHKEYTLIPCDVDASSNAILALYATGVEKEGVTAMAKILLKKCVLHDDGLVDVYFPASDTSTGKLLRFWPSGRRVDLVTTANFLYLLNKFEVIHMSHLSACYDLLFEALASFDRKDKIILYAKNYNNVDVICFFISRLMSVSDYAMRLFKVKLANVVEGRLQLKPTDPISTACRIMVGIFCGLNDQVESAKLLMMLVLNLIEFQNQKDFGFPQVGLYNAHKRFHFGSTALSTAFAIAALQSAKLAFGKELDVLLQKYMQKIERY